MYNYFNADCNLALITKLLEEANLKADQVVRIKEWLTTHFVTPHWQDALHITKCFLLPTIKGVSDKKLDKKLDITLYYIKHDVLYFYKHRHIFPPKDKDIKQYKTFSAFEYVLRLKQDLIDNDWKTARKDFKPIYEDDNFVIYCADTFLKCKVLNNGHPDFNKNYYLYCFGQCAHNFKKHCFYNDERVVTIYYIRVKNKTPEYNYVFPRRQYTDPTHIVVLMVSLDKILVFSTAKLTPIGEHTNMTELLTVYPQLTPYKEILIHRKDDKID